MLKRRPVLVPATTRAGRGGEVGGTQELNSGDREGLSGRPGWFAWVRAGGRHRGALRPIGCGQQGQPVPRCRPTRTHSECCRRRAAHVTSFAGCAGCRSGPQPLLLLPSVPSLLMLKASCCTRYELRRLRRLLVRATTGEFHSLYFELRRLLTKATTGA